MSNSPMHQMLTNPDPAIRRQAVFTLGSQAANVFLLNPRNRDFVMGRDQKPSGLGNAFGCGILFLLPFLLMGIALALGAYSTWVRYAHLTQSGVRTTAQVTEKYTEMDDDDDTTHHIRYQFTLADSRTPGTYTGSGRVSAGEYDALRVGGSVQVTYYAANPAESMLANDAQNPAIPIALTFSSAMTLLISLGGLWLVNAAAERHAYLVKHGQILDGEIMRVTTHTDSDDDYHVTIYYRFTAPDGTVIEKEARGMRNDLRRQGLPARGSIVKLLYADNKRFMLL